MVIEISRPTRGSARRRPGVGWLPVAGVACAAGVGLAVGQRAVLTLAVLAAVAAVLVLVLNVELAVLAFVAVEPFESYVKTVTASGVKLFGALVVVAWLVRVLTRERAVQLGHPAVRAVGVLFALLLAATVAHPNGADGTEVFLRYLSFLSVFVVLVDCMHDRLTPRRVAAVYVASCTVAAAVGLVMFFRGAYRAGGPISDPNDFAFFLISALPIAVGMRAKARQPRLYDAAALVMSAGVLATLSRGALTGAAAMVVFAILTGIVGLRVVLGWAIVVGLIVAGVAIANSGKVSTSLSAKDKVAQANVDERLVLWQAAGEMTADNPVLGTGPAGFRENYPRYVDYRTSDTTHPIDVDHEMYLEVAAELGVPALAAFVAMIGFGFAGARRARQAGQDPGLAAGVLAAIVGTAVAAAFLTEQYYLPVWLLVALGAALDPRTGVR